MTHIRQYCRIEARVAHLLRVGHSGLNHSFRAFARKHGSKSFQLDPGGHEPEHSALGSGLYDASCSHGYRA